MATMIGCLPTQALAFLVNLCLTDLLNASPFTLYYVGALRMQDDDDEANNLLVDNVNWRTADDLCMTGNEAGPKKNSEQA